MIIPKISGRGYSADEPGLNNLLDQLKFWSLFGKVALVDVDQFQLPQLEWIVKRIGGSVDLEIEQSDPNEAAVLALLNVGAATVICLQEQATALPSVPSQRLTHLYREADRKTLTRGDQLEIKQPTCQQIVQFQKTGVGVLVDVAVLENAPALIADTFAEILVSDRPDGLWPTLIVDSLGLALGLAYSNYESLLDAITHRRGTYWSRSRDELWVKGLTSGATQGLIGIRLDCDQDCLRFMVHQGPPGFCHRNTHSCFGNERTIESVVQRLSERINSADEKSFTKKLIDDRAMLQAKLLEEAQELAEADTKEEVTWETADVLYFSFVKMLGEGVKLEEVYHELARRMNRVVRRKNKLEE